MSNVRSKVRALERQLVEPRDPQAEARARERFQEINRARARVGMPPIPIPDKIELTDRKVDIVAEIYKGRERARRRNREG